MRKLDELLYSKIKTDEQYNAYCKKLRGLIFNKTKDNPDNVNEHIELLSLLINDWNERQYDGNELDPISMLKSLMKDHGLKQQHIAEICEVNKSFVSEVLNYKKYLSKKMIRKLADHFKIRQDGLNQTYKLEERTVFIVDTHQMYMEPKESKLFNESHQERYLIGENKPLFSNHISGIFDVNITAEC